MEHGDQGRACRHNAGDTQSHPADRPERRIEGDAEGRDSRDRDLRHEGKARDTDRDGSDSDRDGGQGLHYNGVVLRELRRDGQGARPDTIELFNSRVEILANHDLEVSRRVLHLLFGVRGGVRHSRVGRLSDAEGVLHGVQSRIELLGPGVVKRQGS